MSAKRIQEEQQKSLGNDTLQVGADNMAFEMRRWKNERWDDIRIQTEIIGEGYSNSMDGEQITKIGERMHVFITIVESNYSTNARSISIVMWNSHENIASPTLGRNLSSWAFLTYKSQIRSWDMDTTTFDFAV